jgi:hypothetical protein
LQARSQQRVFLICVSVLLSAKGCKKGPNHVART